LIKLHTIGDVREFWEVFNNFDVTRLPLRDSVHLFHKGVKPVWEDPRNVRGGAWTFRVPKDKAKEFWSAIAMMAIGESLQEAVASKRLSKFGFPTQNIPKGMREFVFAIDILTESRSICR
jgi:hypothetical protein